MAELFANLETLARDPRCVLIATAMLWGLTSQCAIAVERLRGAPMTNSSCLLTLAVAGALLLAARSAPDVIVLLLATGAASHATLIAATIAFKPRLQAAVHK